MIKVVLHRSFTVRNQAHPYARQCTNLNARVTRASDLEHRRPRAGGQIPEPPQKKHKGESISSVQSTTFSSPVSPSNTLRCLIEDNVRSRFPGIRLKSDLEALLLATSTEGIPPMAVQAWVDKAIQEVGGDLSVAEARATQMMDRPAEVTGAKPRVGECDIILLPIPGSNAAVRVWPGSASRAEYNVDFFDSETSTSIRIPDGYALVLLHPPHTYLPPQRLMTLDETFGQRWPIAKRGGGSYVLRDGQTFALFRADTAADDAVIIQFTVPSRE